MYVPFTLHRTSYDDIVVNYEQLDVDYCEIRAKVLNPLEMGSGASQTVTISAHAIFKEAHFYVPKNADTRWIAESLGDYPTQVLDTLTTSLKKVTGDIIDIGRNAIREMTGFHNPNIPYFNKAVINSKNNRTNAVDIPTHMEQMYPHSLYSRIYDDYYFRTDVDEMSIKHLTSKPTFTGTIKITNTDSKGTLLFSHPITPFVEIKGNSTSMSPDYYSPLRTIYEHSTHWRGGMRLQIQSVCSNFHYFKILVVKMYNNSEKMLDNSTHPSMGDVENLLTETIEFNAGGQIHEIDLPFVSMIDQLPCTKDTGENAVHHGMVYIYLVQPLVSNGSVPTNVYLNTFMRGGEDLVFSGFAVSDAKCVSDTTLESNSGFSRTRRFKGESTSKLEVNCSLVMALYCALRGLFRGCRRLLRDDVEESNDMKAESGEVESNVATSTQDPILTKREDALQRDYKLAYQPNVSIRDYLRRFVPIDVLTHDVDRGETFVVEVGDALLCNDKFNAFNPLSTLFLGLSGGLKFKIKVENAISASVLFAPPGNVTSATKTFMSTGTTDTGLAVSNVIKQGYAGKHYPIPVIEMPNMYNGHVNHTVMEFECLVPNLNHLNYVGSPTKYGGYRTPLNTMGHLVITTKRTNSEDVRVTIYAALADESRLGMQVYSPKKTVSTFTVGGITYRKTPLDVDNTIDTAMGFPRAIPLKVQASKCYYVKT